MGSWCPTLCRLQKRRELRGSTSSRSSRCSGPSGHPFAAEGQDSFEGVIVWLVVGLRWLDRQLERTGQASAHLRQVSRHSADTILNYHHSFWQVAYRASRAHCGRLLPAT